MKFFARIWHRLKNQAWPNFSNFAVKRLLMRGPTIACLRFLVNAIALPAIIGVSLFRRRISRASRPAVLFGITPLINNKAWSQALKREGYKAASFVYGVYVINTKDDFDYSPEKVFPRASCFRLFFLLEPYLCFFWGLKNFDVFVFDFDLGFLRRTPLRFLELPLFRLAGRKIIGISYGGDVSDVRRCKDEASRTALLQDYPDLAANADEIRRRVRHYTRWASFIVSGGGLIDFLPRVDFMVTNLCGIDSDEWDNRGGAPAGNVNNWPIKILHAPNHRHIKGTPYLIAACEELRREGMQIELIIKERVPNREILEVMREVDIVASAFITGFYELFAVEGMSMGKPVLNYWRPDLKELYTTHSYASECPIVDTPVGMIKENIRMLANDPELRARLGTEGRRYVEKHHSYDAIGKMLARIITRVWLGEEELPAKEVSSERSVTANGALSKSS